MTSNDMNFMAYRKLLTTAKFFLKEALKHRERLVFYFKVNGELAPMGLPLHRTTHLTVEGKATGD
ncbi:hypothetical protein HS1genome_0878 [Sulfodiicoccus acidiphilus]|uniref:Uncharacterized protein n=1 Tax=Sulfodiicoccus acidiphilus TaxID=1670455 RepID=A0A348B2T7_9CREN|nr:hypothetical protein HS1genome_0878 [Sulfodiicoccus acidiphilus]GGT96756.1 hypothetical protein GCM10007116_12810 [Sulfodiicoccus acidiphilus]